MSTVIDESILIPPYGGDLIDLTVPQEQAGELKARASGLPSIQLSERATCDLDLLATGAFSPLYRFMGEADYGRVLGEMRLGDGTLFPIPVTLPIDDPSAVKLDQDVALRDSRNELLAVMTVQEAYEWDMEEAADQVFGTRDLRHPLVSEMHRWGRLNISGPLQVLQLPPHHDFRDLRLTPAETRARLARYGYPNVVAFQTRNPLHRVHEELTKRAAESVDGVLLLHPVVGLTKPGDVDHYTRVRTYRALAERYYEPDRILLALLPLAMRLAGPREALWHAIIRRNYGANHLIVGRDHAGVGTYYGSYDAHHIFEEFGRRELGITPLFFENAFFCRRCGGMATTKTCPHGENCWVTFSGTFIRHMLRDGEIPPPEFTRPEVAQILMTGAGEQ